MKILFHANESYNEFYQDLKIVDLAYIILDDNNNIIKNEYKVYGGRFADEYFNFFKKSTREAKEKGILQPYKPTEEIMKEVNAEFDEFTKGEITKLISWTLCKHLGFNKNILVYEMKFNRNISNNLNTYIDGVSPNHFADRTANEMLVTFAKIFIKDIVNH